MTEEPADGGIENPQVAGRRRVDAGGMSLPGIAREGIVELAVVAVGADARGERFVRRLADPVFADANQGGGIVAVAMDVNGQQDRVQGNSGNDGTEEYAK